MDEIYLVKKYNPSDDTWSNLHAFSNEDDAEDFIDDLRSKAVFDDDETYDIEHLPFND